MATWTYIFALVLVAFASAEVIKPEVGDIGTMSKCVPITGDDGEQQNECRTCKEEREENEEEEGEEVDGVRSIIQECIDSCSSLYIIEQLEDKKVLNDDGEYEYFRQIRLNPGISCIDGCQCPTGTGISEKAMENEDGDDDDDNDKVEYEEQQYIVTFETMEGEIDTKGYLQGQVTIEYKEPEEGDDQEEKEEYPVSFMITYATKEINEDGQEEMREEECQIDYKITAGKIGGIKGESGEAPEIPEIPNIATLGKIKRVATYPEYCAEAEEGSEDECFYKCAAGYQVQTLNNTMNFIPAVGAISTSCKCFEGKAVQSGYGQYLEKAHAMFAKDPTSLCTSTFTATNLSLVIAKNEEYNNAMTIQYYTSANEVCTAEYKIVQGAVMGRSGSSDNGGGEENGLEDPNNGTQVIVCLVVSLVILILFIAPSCMPSSKKYQPVH